MNFDWTMSDLLNYTCFGSLLITVVSCLFAALLQFCDVIALGSRHSWYPVDFLLNMLDYQEVRPLLVLSIK